MLNAHISAIYLQKYKKNQKNDFKDGFCLQGELDLTLFVCKGITKMSLVLSWVPSTQFLFTSLFISFLTSISTSLSVIFYFFRSLVVLSSVFYVLRFLVFAWVLVLAILLTFRIESPTLHIIFIRLLRAKTMNISSQLYYHD